MQGTSEAVIARVESLRARFMQRCLDDAEAFDRLSAQIESPDDSDEARAEARSKVHRLAGAGTVFGFAELSEHAADLQQQLDGACGDREAARGIRALKVHIRESIAAAPGGGEIASGETANNAGCAQ